MEKEEREKLGLEEEKPEVEVKDLLKGNLLLLGLAGALGYYFYRKKQAASLAGPTPVAPRLQAGEVAPTSLFNKGPSEAEIRILLMMKNGSRSGRSQREIQKPS